MPWPTASRLDWLFIGTGPGKRFAHDQLSRFDSELSKDGRELARKLEKKVRVPVYYYLSKHFGRSGQAERRRKCPSCGSAWLRKEPLHRIFDFKCRRCRLLSNVAFDTCDWTCDRAECRSSSRASRTSTVT